MSRRCPYCQAQVSASARFCTACGQPVATPGQAGPRLHATWPGGSAAWDVDRSTMTLGRQPNCDICIDFPVVSRQHARVERIPSGLRLVDLGSLNKFVVDGRVVSDVHMGEGRAVRIGDGGGNSVVLRLGWQDQPIDRDHKGRPRRQQQPPKTIRLDGTDPMTSIGRDPTTSLHLDHPQVSWHHARVERRGSAHFLVDLGSTNGTYVNGQLVRREQHLQQGDRVRIGPFRLEFTPKGMTVPHPGPRGMRIDVSQLYRRVTGPKLILQDVTMTVEPNELVALVGGSGTGKSTLLKAINGFEPGERMLRPVGDGRLTPDRSSGPIRIDGQDLYREYDAFRPLIGYVPQSDIIHRSLTVEQALDFVAQLRLPPDTTRAERQESITKVLGDVNMHNHRRTRFAHLSGGQQKRISTAVELLARPRILFLDEPTSGLDPGLDKKMMSDFRALADDGRTVLLVTHATTNINQCDHVVFLARGGRLAFFGPPKDALSFFGKKDFADIYTALDDEDESVVDDWIGRFKRSDIYNRYVGARLHDARSESSAESNGRRAPRGIGSFRQWGILCRRYFKLMLGDGKNLLILLAQAPIIGAILYAVSDAGILAPDEVDNAFKVQPILNTMAIVAVWFGVSNGAREITKESAIYMRERMASLKIVPYVMSKVAVLTILCVIQTAVLMGIVLSKIGAPETEPLWTSSASLELYGTLLLTSLAGLATGLFLSAWAANEDRAMSLTPLILVPQLILSGVSFELSGVAEGLSRLTLSYWATHALGSQVDLCGFFGPDGCPEERINLMYEYGAESVMQDWLALGGYTVLFVLLTMWWLKRKDVM